MVNGLKVGRRGVLLGCGAALAAPTLLMSQELDAFREIAPPRLRIGSILKDNPPPQQIELIRHHCNVFTSENGLKIHKLTEDPPCGADTLNTSSIELAMGLARETPALQHHAHAFFWPKHPWPACYVADINGFAAAFARVIKGAVSCDVLNEVLKETPAYSVKEEENRLEELRQQGFDPDDLDQPDRRAAALGFLLNDEIPGETGADKLRFLADVVIALRKALTAVGSGHTQLVINEYELAWGISASALKRKAVLALADELKRMTSRREGADAVTASVEVIGMQGHLVGNQRLHPKPDELSRWVQEVGVRGYRLHVSELDVKYACWDRGGDYTEESHEALIRRFLEPVLPHRHVGRLSFWGLLDDLHFFQVAAGETGRDPRFFCERAQPTLFRADGSAKPAAQAVAEILRALDT